MASEKHIYVMRGDDLVLDCTLLARLPKASIDWKYSGHHSRPLPSRTIISRKQLILNKVTEALDPIYCFTSLGVVSWEEKFKISTLSTSEIKRKFNLQRKISLCQTSIGIVRCHASKILDPAENLKAGVLESLDKSQSVQFCLLR